MLNVEQIYSGTLQYLRRQGSQNWRQKTQAQRDQVLSCRHGLLLIWSSWQSNHSRISHYVELLKNSNSWHHLASTSCSRMKRVNVYTCTSTSKVLKVHECIWSFVSIHFIHWRYILLIPNDLTPFFQACKRKPSAQTKHGNHVTELTPWSPLRWRLHKVKQNHLFPQTGSLLRSIIIYTTEKLLSNISFRT